MYDEYIGNLHVHSNYSDGSGTILEIARAGQKAGIDFVVINDHYTLQALHNQEEGYYDDLLILVGTEINKYQHHYLALGVEKEIANNDLEPQQVIDEVNSQGGIGFIAHPFEVGSPLFFGGKTYTWNDWSVTGFTGICIWNYCSQWRDGADTVSNSLYTTFVNPHWRITGPCPKALAKIDLLGQQRKVVAIGGTDAHAVKVNLKFTTVTVFSYDFLFRTVNTHVLLPHPLTGNLAQDKQLIYGALKAGNSFVAFDFYESSRNFRFAIKDQKSSKIVMMGEETAFQPGMLAKIRLPKAGVIKLILNGSCIKEAEAAVLTFPLSKKGVYRVEAYLKQSKALKKKLVPWIFSNPIFLR